ncbi:MAG: ribonuclease HII [Mangrovicoccus sp.]|nr:ribonuclease HII [Mangrovicoccus sp.]
MARTPPPDDRFEAAALAQGATRVAGIDEVGRGPLAGPVAAAAVVLDMTALPQGLRDSKQLSAKRRAALAQEIRACAEVSLAFANVEEIEQLNILGAAHLAMARAAQNLSSDVDFALIDGKYPPKNFPLRHQMVVKGDARSLSIAAASIVAKVARDELMTQLAQDHPGYGWERNMGYPTAEHRAALERLGITQHHRRTFAPVHKILCK